MTDNPPESEPTGTEPTEPKATEPKSGRVALFDKTFLRFVGGTHENKTAAKKAAKALQDSGRLSDDYEARTV